MSVSRLRTLPKRLLFLEENRNDISFSDSAKIRLVPKDNLVRLTQVESPFFGVGSAYSTDADLYAITPTTNPDAIRQWIGFQCDVVHGKVGGVAVTSVGFRLYDGSDQYWWDGDSWEIETGSNWNTEAEIATNISSYNALDTKTLGIVVNLVTANSSYTPEVKGVRLAYKADLQSFQGDVIYRTIMQGFKTVRAVFDFVMSQVETGTSVSLGTALDTNNSPFLVTDVVAIYDHDGDPDHETDLFSSYNSSTRVITLSGSVAADTTLFVVVEYRPAVAFDATHPDYVELSQTPSVYLSGLDQFDSHPLAQDEAVVDKEAGTLVQFPPPYRTNYRCGILVSAPGGVTQQRLVDAVAAYIEENRVMRTKGTDEPFALRLDRPFDSDTKPAGKGIHAARSRLEMRELCFYRREALTSGDDAVYPVQTVVLDAARQR